MKICPKCNEEQDINNLYCFNCGSRFTRFYSYKQFKCPGCNQFQDLKNKFCIHCGQELSDSPGAVIKCPQCHEKIAETSPICPNCGHDFIEKNMPKIKPPHVSRLLKFKRGAIFSSNYGFNLKQCPKCNSELLLGDLFCYNCGSDVEHIEKQVQVPKQPKVSKLLKFKRQTVFLSNYGFNLRQCPKCNSKLLGSELFCHNCGEKVGCEDISGSGSSVSQN